VNAGAGPRFEVRIDDRVLAEDLSHYTKAGRAAVEAVVDELRRDGVPREWLRRCEEEGHDGTRLGGCVKFYIPQPAGRLGRFSPVMKRPLGPHWCWSRSASAIRIVPGGRASTRSRIAASTV